MTANKDDDTGSQDVDNTPEDDDVDNDDDDSDDEAGWARLGDIVDKAVEKRLDAWSAKQGKTTSSPSPRKRAEAKPKRKQGFLSGQFFSNLNPTDDK